MIAGYLALHLLHRLPGLDESRGLPEHEVLREELRGSGVRSTLVSPSGVDTPLWEALAEPGNPRERSDMLRADDVVNAVMYAISQPRDVNV